MYAISVQLATPETTYLPVSVAEAKLHLRVDHSYDDDLILRLIKAATEQAEEFTGLQIRNATVIVKLSKFPKGREPLYLPRHDPYAITVFDYVNSSGTAIDFTDGIVYNFDDASYIEPTRNTQWPTNVDTQLHLPISISYAAGYENTSSVPNAIKQAILLQVGAMYEYREATSDKNITKIANGFYDLLMPHVIGDEFHVYNEARIV